MQQYQFTGHCLTVEEATNLSLLVNRYNGTATSTIHPDSQAGFIVEDTVHGSIAEAFKQELEEFYLNGTCLYILIERRRYSRGEPLFQIPLEWEPARIVADYIEEQRDLAAQSGANS